MTSGADEPAWRVVDIPLDASDDDDGGDKPLGTKEKFWVFDPDGVPWLFKYARDKGGSSAVRTTPSESCITLAS